MKDNRHKQYQKINSKNSGIDIHMHVDKPLMPFVPIIFNLIVVIALVVTWYYIMTYNYIPDYQGYVYWGINGLITYNVLLGSARSFLMPIFTSIAAIGLLYCMRHGIVDFVTPAEGWQSLALGGIGFIISCVTRLR